MIAGAFCILLWAQPAAAREMKREEITSAYIFNFAKNIRWPGEDRIPEFRLLVISDDKAINREILRLSASAKLKGKPIKVTISESIIIPKGIHLVYIARGLEDLAAPIFRRIEGHPCLLITDGFDDKRIVMINLVETSRKTIRFEINKANILNQGLQVLPEMVLLGGTEIDVARLYKESQDSLRIKEGRIADLRRHLDSIVAEIAAAHKEIAVAHRTIAAARGEIADARGEIAEQNLLIARQNQDILERKIQLERQRDTLSRQSALLANSQRALERQQDEIAAGKSVLSDQQRRIDIQNASILRQKTVLAEQDVTISSQKSIQRFLLLIIMLVLALAYAIFRGYRGKQLANRRLQEQESQIRRLNRDLQERAAALEAANKELEAFSYSVSHDLRAPLRSIDGFSQAILEDYGEEIDDRGKDYLRRVRSAAQRMAVLIDDMLDLSRVTRNEMAMQEIDLSGMAEDIAEKLRRQQPDRRVEVLIQPGLSAWGDGHLLRIALDNLFENAWKYTSKHPTARIEFGSRTLGREQVCFLKDDGAGFDSKYAQKLFGAFQRMHTVEEFPGTGVGLATVQRIIHRHGGRIWAESEVEKGATFHFTLPGKES